MNLDWMSKAKCKDHPNPDIFFPGGAGQLAVQQAEQAAQVCRGCPVTVNCLLHKQSTGAVSGVWAGGVHRTKALGRRG